MKRKKYIILAAILAAAAIVIIAAARRHGKTAVKVEQEERIIPVETEKVMLSAISETVEGIGDIEPFKTVVVYTEATGILEKLTVKEGDVVTEGQLIATIEGKQRELAVQQIESEKKAQEYQLENIKRDYDRYKRLSDEGVISPKKFEDMETLYNATLYRIKGLEAQLETARRRLRDTTITAPMTGLVAQKFIDEGELVTESTMTKSSPLVSIVDISKVKVSMPVGESDIKKVKVGQKAILQTDVYRGKNFTGRVNNIMLVTDIASRTTTVEIAVENPGYMLKQGMFTRVSIDTGTRKALAVSLDALMRMPGSGSYYCFRMLEDGTVEKVYIDIGSVKDGIAEVTAGLKEGDTVVVTSQGVLETGMKVVHSTPSPVSSPVPPQGSGGQSMGEDEGGGE